MKVKLITATPDAEKMIGYVARVSSPQNQDNPNVEGLLKYCAKHGHWSVFETASATIEIETSMAIAMQILRHRSAKFQQFSGRYSTFTDEGVEIYTARRQDTKNRQNSIDDLPYEVVMEWRERQKTVFDMAYDNYEWALQQGIAKECARMVLPMNTRTRMYMTADFRTWIHYLALRSGNGSQKEHIDVANAIIDIFKKEFPLTYSLILYTKKSQELLNTINKDIQL